MQKVARVAVSSAALSFDKPFDYIVPEAFSSVQVGCRVLVPFGMGNRAVEGFVLSLSETEDTARLKELLFFFDDEVRLSDEDMALALWMRNRCFCTFFDCADAMIPPGVWQKTVQKYALAEGLDFSQLHLEDKPEQKAVLEALTASDEALTIPELCDKCGGSLPDRAVKALVKSGAIREVRQFSGKGFGRTIRMIEPTVDMGDLPDIKLMGRGAAAERRNEALFYLSSHGETAAQELSYQTGATSADIKFLIKKGWAVERDRPAYMAQTAPDEALEPYVLSTNQQKVYDGVIKLAQKGASCALLRGVTGSGKTAVYIELIRYVVSQGKTAMMLVPEIALTPQMLRQFRGHFGSRVAIMHSGLDPASRYDEYMKVRTGRATVVVGTRSAVFAPCENLGIIIIDEEHENSYKSDSAPRYNAIDVAKYRCVKNGCPLLLGSATPSVESYYNAQKGKYSLFTLDERFNDSSLPTAVMADMKESLKDGDMAVLSPLLRDEMRLALDRGEQTILFLNRRGNAKMAFCADCGYIPQCENCSVSLTYHSANGRLMCHHCGYSQPLITKCPQCGGNHIRLVGSGTQRIEEELAELFPDARVLRMDADTTTGRKAHEEILDAFGRGEADILLGTQMVAKGLDFPNVTLVGVLDADMALYSGSYGAAERCFDLISQVSGRAGRRDKPGKAVIQSYMPSNPVIDAAARQDYLAFYDYEIKSRELIKAPPFYDIFTFFFTCPDEAKALSAAQRAADGLKSAFEGRYSRLASPVLGPTPAAIAKINNKYRYVVTFKSKDNKESRQLVWNILKWLSSQKVTAGVTVAADINALSF